MRSLISYIHQSSALTVLLGAIILSWPMIINGAPFYFIDSGYYLLHHPQKADPNAYLWRPLVYNAFLNFPVATLAQPLIEIQRLLETILPSQWEPGIDDFISPIGSLISSVFFSVFLQCCLVSFSLLRLAQLFTSKVQRGRFLASVLTLTIVSPLGFYSNLVMADIFVAVSFLMFIYLMQVKIKRRNWLDLLLAVISMASHYSAILSTAVVSVFSSFSRRAFSRLSVLSTSLMIGGFLSIGIIHFIATEQFKVSNTAQIYFHSHLTSLGVVQPYLAEACIQQDPIPFKACQFLDVEFHIWDFEKGQRVQKMGGLRAMEADIRKINMSFLTSPYVFLYLKKGIGNATRQWVTFSSAIDLIVEDSYLEKEMALFSKRELQRFQLQRIVPSIKGELWAGINAVWGLLFVLSLLWTIKVCVSRRTKNDVVLTDTVGMFALLYLCNGIVIGLLTDVNTRYSNRLIWIPIAIVVFYLFHHRSTTAEEVANVRPIWLVDKIRTLFLKPDNFKQKEVRSEH